MSNLLESHTSAPTIVRPSFAVNLEALRGFAALIVILSHAVGHKGSLDPAYVADQGWQMLLPGHACLLLFFLLSGYVIGITNKRPLTVAGILPYLKKRIVRLYPIYLLALLLTLAVATTAYPFTTIAGHFLFLQNAAVPLIWENNPLWSLNYEVLFYLLFIPLSLFRFAPGRVAVGSLLIGVLCGTVLPFPLLSSYAYGFFFWVAGLWLANTPNLFPVRNASRGELASMLVIFMAYPILNPFMLATLLARTKLHLPLAPSTGLNIPIDDLFQLPICLYFLLRFTNRTIRLGGWLIAAIIASGLLFFAYMAVRYGVASGEANYFLPALIGLVVGAISLWVTTRSKQSQPEPVSATLIKIGSISYAVYAIHFPISLLLSRVGTFSGTAISFLGRLALELLLVLMLSYVLERKLQPWIKERFA